MSTPFTFDVAASPLQDGVTTEKILAPYRDLVSRTGGQRLRGEEAPPDQPLVHVVVTGGTEDIVLARMAEREERAGTEPVILVALPDHNSLPACLEILARVRRDGGSGRIVALAGGDDPLGGTELADIVRLAGVRLALRRTRIGVIGAPSDWLVASAHSPEIVRRTWGPEVVQIAIEAVTGAMSATAPDDELGRDLSDRACECREPDAGAIGHATAVYTALRGITEAHNLDALTLRCFDLVTGEGTTGCLALSRLCDEGIPAGCEGDVPSIVALAWLHLLTHEVPWMANPARINSADGEILLAHCTAPRTLLRSYGLRSHFESGLGAAIQGDLVPGPVTLVRLGGATLDRMWACEGELVESPHEEGLCRTQARVLTGTDPLHELLERPLGNHVVVVRGHLLGLLRESRRFIVE